MSTSQSATVADSFRQSPDVVAALDAVIQRLESSQSSITEPRPPVDGGTETLEGWLARSAEARGKGALYPYVGSGIGNGPLVELVDGSVKWDMINGIGVHMFGHSDPGLVRVALESALGDVVMEGNLQYNSESIETAEFLSQEAAKGSRLSNCFTTNSGAMANESALKVCQQKTNGAPRVIAFQDCFLGRSTTMAQIGDSAAGRVGIPLNTHVDYMPFYDPAMGERSIEMAVWHLDECLKRYPGQHSCFIFELVQGEGGFRTAPREFFVPLMEMCRERGVPVWDDEVQTFGRNTEMYYYDVLGLGEYVDVLTLGKMSQICACLYTDEFNPKPGLLSGTFIGSSSALQVGLAALRRLRDGGYYGPDGRIAGLQAAFREHANAFVAAHPEWFPPAVDTLGRPITELVAGTGGMCRLTPFGGSRAKIMKALHIMFAEGLIAFICGHDPYHLRFLPPVGVMEPAQFGPVFEVLERSFEKAEAAD
ncbi:MAG: aminotransferase class III-fold pyridoxal phosphate-dependent enzyme [Phycisphaerales bacterium]|nr:aminotransferase class III-fold pyridoxal phosphate-dependent enzyme [Phycisphaerales bacterium]